MTRPWIVVSVSLIGAYLLLVRKLRYRRILAVHAAYAKRHGLSYPPPLTRQDPTRGPTRKELPMTPREAQEILLPGFKYDFPFLAGKALEFALFKTYGIPTISELLDATTEFIKPDRAGRRYVDTAVLIISWIVYPLEGPGSGVEADESQLLDPRGAVAIARTNYIHSRYAGKITNDDYLYTLSTFCFEIGVWCSKFSWRPLTPLEEMAWFVFFSEVGRRMEIQGIPTEMDDFRNWAEEYEKQYMVPFSSNATVALGTIRLLLHNIPTFLHPFGIKVITTLLYPRLRKAILLPPSPLLLTSMVHGTLKFHAWVQRHLVLPRMSSNPKRLVPLPEHERAFPEGFVRMTGEEGEEKYAPRSHPVVYENEAWYMAEPSGISHIAQKLLLLLRLKRQDQVPGPTYKPEGYRLETCGPVYFEKSGEEEVRKIAERLQGSKLEGPFAVGGVGISQCPFRRD